MGRNVKRKVFQAMPDAISEMKVTPLKFSRNLFRIGVKQQFVMVEAHSVGGIVTPMHAVSVEQAWPSLRQIAMPNLIGLLHDIDTMQFAPPSRVE